jgi:hypothetical protein
MSLFSLSLMIFFSRHFHAFDDAADNAAIAAIAFEHTLRDTLLSRYADAVMMLFIFSCHFHSSSLHFHVFAIFIFLFFISIFSCLPISPR